MFKVVEDKVVWVKGMGFGGFMFWEVSGDCIDEKSLICVSFLVLGKFDICENLLSYLNSQYVNIVVGLL